jgi:predicted metal-dependent hydrolase
MPAERHRLDGVMGAFPASLCDYVEKFNARQYMAAAHHEEMVAVWNRAQSHFYRGLMILAAAFVHLQRGTPEGARIKFRKAREQLSPLPAHYLGVDVSQIVEHIDQASTALEGAARGEPNLLALVPTFSIHLDLRRVRGDEVEWHVIGIPPQ